MNQPPIRITIDELMDRHRVLLLDAYGVLLHHGGPLPGAVPLIQRLNTHATPYFILTNDASHLPASSATRMMAMGLSIAPDRIITSASLLTRYFVEQQLQGQTCVVLGPEDSTSYVQQAGGVVSTPEDLTASVVVVCDEVGYPFVETVDAVLTLLFYRLDRGEPVHLILPNPDLVYPKSAHAFGFTAGCIAKMLEAALEQRYGARPVHRFVRLGKPNPHIFREAARRAPRDQMVMIGDQLRTDIAGALAFGIPAAMVEGGIDRYDPASTIQPTYLLRPFSTD
jgi:HAD superfamily hydrolase (TIGR01450 family)